MWMWMWTKIEEARKRRMKEERAPKTNRTATMRMTIWEKDYAIKKRLWSLVVSTGNFPVKWPPTKKEKPQTFRSNRRSLETQSRCVRVNDYMDIITQCGKTSFQFPTMQKHRWWRQYYFHCPYTEKSRYFIVNEKRDANTFVCIRVIFFQLTVYICNFTKCGKITFLSSKERDEQQKTLKLTHLASLNTFQMKFVFFYWNRYCIVKFYWNSLHFLSLHNQFLCCEFFVDLFQPQWQIFPFWCTHRASNRSISTHIRSTKKDLGTVLKLKSTVKKNTRFR